MLGAEEESEGYVATTQPVRAGQEEAVRAGGLEPADRRSPLAFLISHRNWYRKRCLHLPEQESLQLPPKRLRSRPVLKMKETSLQRLLEHVSVTFSRFLVQQLAVRQRLPKISA